MFLPRRRQRRLLLPPGWMALGFTLLLGCLVLLSHERQLILRTVLQVTMPSVKSSVDAPWNNFVYKQPSELNALRPWHDADFVGAPLTDFVTASTIGNAVLAINADTSHVGGVRIRFRQQATYANLVKALDLMNVVNQKKYWLDIRHQPITLYAITAKDLPVKLVGSQPVYLGCCTCPSEEYTEPLTEATFQQVIAKLCQQAWRPSILLLITISVLSFYRLSRLHRAMC
jgi:hypothetical protein